MVRAPAGPDSAAQVLDERIKNILRDLDHLGGRLVGLLVLQEARCLFVQIFALMGSAKGNGNFFREFDKVIKTVS
jgi:hypothetical protein